MKTTTKHVDGMEVTVAVSMLGMIFVMENLSSVNVLTLRQMFAKLKMEIHVKCLLPIKVQLTTGVPELIAVQIGVTIILQVKNGAIVT